MCDVPSSSFFDAGITEMDETAHAEASSSSKPPRIFSEPCAICGQKASVLSEKKNRCIQGTGLCLSGKRKNFGKIKCRACRFALCISSGMKPLAVTTSKGGDMMLPDLDEGHKKKDDASPFPSAVGPPCQPSTSFAPVPNSAQNTLMPINSLRPVSFIQPSMMHVLPHLGVVEERLQQLRYSACDPFGGDISVLTRLFRPSALSDAARYRAVTDWTDLSLRSPHRRRRELLSASVRDLPEWLIYDLFCNLEYVKTFTEFELLSLEDKVRLVQYSVLPLTVATQCWDSFQRGFTTVVLPDGVSPLAFHVNVLRGTVNRQMYNVFIKVVEPLFRDRVDRNEYLLLKAVLLFDSTVPELSTESAAAIATIRSRFLRLLFDYIREKMGEKKAPARLGALLAHFQLFVTTANAHRSHMMAMEALHREPDDVLIMQTIFREKIL